MNVVLSIIFYATAALVAAGAVVYVVGVHNQMVASAREVDRQFANVEVSLKQRHDEIPALVEVCRGYMKHEQGLFEQLAALRTRFEGATETGAKVRTANELHPILGRLIARSEAHPELHANTLFLRIADRLSLVEDEIADRRELFNASVASYNTYIQIFPQRLLADALGFVSLPFLELEIP